MYLDHVHYDSVCKIIFFHKLVQILNKINKAIVNMLSKIIPF